MGHLLIQVMWATALWLFVGAWDGAGAADVDMKIVSYPDHISRFSEFDVRVRITNNSKTPLRGCNKSEDNCVAFGWVFVSSPSVITLPAKENIEPIQTYGDDYLTPGEAIEKTIRIIPPTSLGGNHAIISLSLLVKDGPTTHLMEQRLTLPVKPPSTGIVVRRILIRAVVYSYLGLSVAALAFLLFGKKARA